MPSDYDRRRAEEVLAPLLLTLRPSDKPIATTEASFTVVAEALSQERLLGRRIEAQTALVQGQKLRTTLAAVREWLDGHPDTPGELLQRVDEALGRDT